jgi:phosphate transport system substrate-binding protein
MSARSAKIADEQNRVEQEGSMKLLSSATTLATGVAMITSAMALDLDPQLPAYKAVSGLSGQMKSVGSDTLSTLMKQWTDGFKELYPDVRIEVESKGSTTAPPALIGGVSQLGPMSRSMESEEVDAFSKKYGYGPTSLPVAVDALAVYVNKDNPVQCLTLQQVDQIFSKDHWNSGGIDVKTWGGVGLTGEWATKPISLFGRNSESGTYETFKETVLYKGEFKNELKEQPDSSTVVKMVAGDKSAIGYSGIGYLTPGVRAVPLAAAISSKCYDTSAESAYSGGYPLSRYLYIYLNRDPKQPLNPIAAEFLKYILSKDGQSGTIKGGFYPITNATRVKALQTLGISADAS